MDRLLLCRILFGFWNLKCGFPYIHRANVISHLGKIKERYLRNSHFEGDMLVSGMVTRHQPEECLFESRTFGSRYMKSTGGCEMGLLTPFLICPPSKSLNKGSTRAPIQTPFWRLMCSDSHSIRPPFTTHPPQRKGDIHSYAASTTSERINGNIIWVFPKLMVSPNHPF